ncbi:hypothetical protein D3C79_1059060 [compost metagenome]
MKYFCRKGYTIMIGSDDTTTAAILITCGGIFASLCSIAAMEGSAIWVDEVISISCRTTCIGRKASVLIYRIPAK